MITLTAETVEAIAERVAELLRGEATTPDLIDAAEVARRLGISRATVYERAGELGAHRIGDGPRARLRFEPERIAERLSAIARTSPPTSTPTRRSARPPGGARRPDLLPIHPRAKETP